MDFGRLANDANQTNGGIQLSSTILKHRQTCLYCTILDQSNLSFRKKGTLDLGLVAEPEFRTEARSWPGLRKIRIGLLVAKRHLEATPKDAKPGKEEIHAKRSLLFEKSPFLGSRLHICKGSAKLLIGFRTARWKLLLLLQVPAFRRVDFAHTGFVHGKCHLVQSGVNPTKKAHNPVCTCFLLERPMFGLTIPMSKRCNSQTYHIPGVGCCPLGTRPLAPLGPAPTTGLVAKAKVLLSSTSASPSPAVRWERMPQTGKSLRKP